MSSEEITLDEFSTRVLDNLSSFRVSWREYHRDAPDTWPTAMAPDDWWEHFVDHEPKDGG